MEVLIQRWEDSAAIKLSESLLERGDLAIGDKVIAHVHSGAILLAKRAPKYRLEELVAQCNLQESASDACTNWENAPAAGRERI
jgi:antitoxin ChpS